MESLNALSNSSNFFVSEEKVNEEERLIRWSAILYLQVYNIWVSDVSDRIKPLPFEFQTFWW